MYGKSSLTALVGLALVATGCTRATPFTDADVTALTDLGQAYVQAVQAGDAARVAALYTEEGLDMPPHAAAVQGRAAIEARYAALPRVSTFTLTSATVEGVGDLAYDRGTWAATMVVEGTDEPYRDVGKYLAVCRRQADGTWLMQAAIWNSDLPLPAP